jgi:hypothetical protein
MLRSKTALAEFRLRNLALLALFAMFGTLASAQDTDTEAESEDGGADDIFIPTEEIPVDEEVTFPVDI